MKGFRKELCFNVPSTRGLVNAMNSAASIFINDDESVLASTIGNLDFGTWEQLFYYEFDGKRSKHMLVKIIGE